MAYKVDDPLTSASASELGAMLDRREVSSEEIVRAHLDRIITLDGRVGAFVAVFRGEALAAARRADEMRSRGEAAGPLLGMPVTVKENLDFAGRPATLGILARKTRPARRDATVVQAVKRAGAVILGQTNVPQLLLSHETRNPVYGVTVNVFSKDHAPGGSSGGEASALAAGMTPLGVGTDIGGSIRVPAHWSGIVGFKPTLDRWSNRGSNGALPGQEGVRSQCGPMARSVRDLLLLIRALDVRAMADDDPLVPPLPFSEVTAVDATKLRVGYFADDGLVTPSQAVGRAVLEAVKVLRDSGATVKPYSPPSMREAIGHYLSLLGADGGRTAFGQLEGAPPEATLVTLKRLAGMPQAVRRALASTLSALGEQRPAWVLGRVGEKTVEQLWALTRWARSYRLELLESLAREQIDVLLCPPHATPAVPHTKSAQFQVAGSYSMLWNLLQFPAGVVPVTTVRSSETERGGAAVDRLDRTAAEVDKASAGLPVGVQIVGKPFRDEEPLAVMLALDDALAGSAERPKVPRLPV
jgi:fatty acid amide hydrolase